MEDLFLLNCFLAKIERQIALLLSKFLHIPEASPLHFQRSANIAYAVASSSSEASVKTQM